MKSISQRIIALQNDLKQNKLTEEQLFQKHVIDSESYFFGSLLNNIDEEYTIKKIISENLDVHINDIVLVGSAQLGFSVKDSKLFAEFDSDFLKSKRRKDQSDLDIAIISPKLFDYIENSVYNFTSNYKTKWTESDFYNAKVVESRFKVPLAYVYFEYFVKGWFRPDMKPKGFDVLLNKKKKSLNEITIILKKRLNRKVALGIYKNWNYFKAYHEKRLTELRLKYKTDALV